MRGVWVCAIWAVHGAARSLNATVLGAYISGNAITHLDIGSRNGGSMRWLTSFLGARGISDVAVAGIDIDPANVATCERRGFRCVVGDVRVLSAEGACVRGVTVFHVLEHVGARRPPNATAPGPQEWWARTYAAEPRAAHELPVVGDQAQSEAGSFDVRDASAAQGVFRAALRLPSSWLLMHGPCFDGDAELRARGFVRSFAAWRLHNAHVTSAHLVDAFVAAGRRGYFFVTAHNPIETSDHARLQPIVETSSGAARHAERGWLCSGAMCDQHRYNASLHPPKASVAFGRAHYEFVSAVAVFGDVAGEAALVLAAQRKNLAKRRGVHVACVAPERGASRDPATCASLLAGLLPR